MSTRTSGGKATALPALLVFDIVDATRATIAHSGFAENRRRSTTWASVPCGAAPATSLIWESRYGDYDISARFLCGAGGGT